MSYDGVEEKPFAPGPDSEEEDKVDNVYSKVFKSSSSLNQNVPVSVSSVYVFLLEYKL